MRKGFTIGETMVATLILGIVLAAVMTTFLSAQRMLATSMAESELALASRGLREKLLFHAAPAVDVNSGECIVAKNRHGEMSTVKLHWQGEFMRFTDVEDRYD